MSSSMVQLENFRIPLEEIILATRNFSTKSQVGNDGSGIVYKGQLSEGWQNRFVTIRRLDPHGYQGHREFVNELELISRFHHQNIIPFVGYCDEGDEMIVVYEYAVNGSLDEHLQNPDKSRRLSWAQRLKICIGAAKGLQYLHSGLADGYRVIHRNIKSANILLDENLEAKICDFGLSKQGPRNQQDTLFLTKVAGTNFYMDPVYYESAILRVASDVYSLGVVLFELLTGMLAYQPKSFHNENPGYLIQLVRRYHDDGPEKLIDPHVITQIDDASFHMFENIAYECISLNQRDRPTTKRIIERIEIALDYHNQRAASTITLQSHRYQKLETFLIPLEEISLATRDFSHETRIGDGEYCVVYKGNLSERWQNRSAAFKCYHHTDVFGALEFHKKVMMISTFNHDNIIDFIGYCDEGDEMIIVSEYATNGNLNHHLQDPIKSRCITWMQRLKICLGVAKALKYLHSGLGEGSRIIHRDVTSENILLNDNLEAKICGFHLSLLVHHNKPIVYENVVGTEYYLDPVYNESGIVETNSDVYSFGVVLFEMLSGMLACQGRSIDDDDDEPQKLITLVRRYYDDGLDSLIDPNIRDQITSRSSRVFKEIAYQCLSWNVNDRPTMNTIIKMIEEALYIQSPRAMPPITKRSNQYQNLQSFLIPLKEIRLATEDFSPETQIGADGFGVVYKGQLSHHWQNRTAAFKRLDPIGGFGEEEFLNKVDMISSFKHENIIPFIGFCDEGNEKIVVYEYAISGSLSDHLQNPDKVRLLTWAQRLNICIGAARGLRYLHTSLGEDNRVIHRDIKGANILLDDKLEAKICGFDLSLELDRDQPQVYVRVLGTGNYLDPISRESGIVKIESDIYSFGVMLFEMLNGMLACEERSIGDEKPQKLINLVRRYYDDGPGTLADPLIKDQINIHSLHEFKKIAYRCISLNLKDRPTTNRIIKRIEEALHLQKHGAASTITTQSHELDNFLIPIKDINLATGNFNSKNLIGDGGFGMVYKGQLSVHKQNCIVAIKRLDPKGHQGEKEFLSELKLIASFHHQNIIPFVGYCKEDDEMIIVSRYATNGSLDYHLRDPSRKNSLTWAQRLKICLGAAKGLDYLHSGLGKDHRVIHRDVKSANILLDENLEAKICDFGLSKEGLGNQQITHVYTKAAGTNFYLDPVYHESGILSKKSDVYSFGVVLFEMLSGTLAYIPTKFVDGSPQFLINLVRRYYNDGPEKLVDPILRDKIDSRSFHIFKEVAYQSISLNSKERPTMDTIIDVIEDAMDFHHKKDEKLRRTTEAAKEPKI